MSFSSAWGQQSFVQELAWVGRPVIRLGTKYSKDRLERNIIAFHMNPIGTRDKLFQKCVGCDYVKICRLEWLPITSDAINCLNGKTICVHERRRAVLHSKLLLTTRAADMNFGRPTEQRAHILKNYSNLP